LASLSELREDAIQALGQRVEHSGWPVAMLGPLEPLVYRPEGSGMASVRSDDDARLLEQRLVVLRWIVAAFGAVQVGFAIRDRASDPTFVLPLGVALVVGLTLGNVAIAGAARKAEGAQLRALGILAFALVVGAVAGSFASLSRREAAVAARRARDAEAAAARAEEAATREGQARGEVAAFHAAALAEPDMDRLAPTLQPTAEAIAKELGCDALGILVRDRGSAGEVGFVAYGVHGDPGH